jgi:hypothetical protein
MQHADELSILPYVKEFKSRYNNLMLSTAHESYANKDTSDFLEGDVHCLGGPGFPPLKPDFFSKKNIMIVSPDEHPYKAEVLKKIKEAFPALKLVEIKNMKYKKFLYFTRVAKWSITFGEGLDAYLVYPILKGAIGFAVYNEEFFTKDYLDMESVFSDYESMADSLCQQMKKLDNQLAYESLSASLQRVLANKGMNPDGYHKNVIRFYKGEYDIIFSG